MDDCFEDPEEFGRRVSAARDYVSLDPSELPTTSDGSVDEEALDTIGEVPETPPGRTGTATLDLTA